MVVKTVLRFSPWAPSPFLRRRRRSYRVTLRVLAVEGMPPLPAQRMAAAVEVAWKLPPRAGGALSYLMGRKKKQVRKVSSRRPVESSCAAILWDADGEGSQFESPYRFRDPELVNGPGSDGDWDVSFSVLCGNDEVEGGKADKLEIIGTTMASLAEWAKEFQSHKTGETAKAKELKKQLRITLKKDDLISYGMLHITISFTEVTKEALSNEEKAMVDQKERHRDNSGSMVLDQPTHVEDEEDTSTVNSSQSHITSYSNSGRSSPDSDSSSKHWLLCRKRSKISDSFQDLKVEETESVLESDRNDDPIGSWRREEFISRDKQTKLKIETFFASIDQRDPSAGGESACTAIVAVIANALHKNELSSPTKSKFDELIREGSSEWQNLCSIQSYINRFPDKHFDLETILEAKKWPISVLPDKSFIGFFQPESFKSLCGAMSFNDVWHEITRDLGGEIKIYIVSWNDHFFILKLDADAYYIMDTLGERLYEGCNKAYMLRFDDSTEMYRLREEEKGVEDCQELICRGKECCREFINRFLAAIPLQEELELEKKGVEANTALHQRLQIELHLTEAAIYK
ncbi:hypothetical protein Cni_G02566 [Canna indica]|uniref:C2 NT-type domain-containing protein n=1 Tax=Canna indica TaxID=4628 RepID=A0AAQ3Q2A3_9LILI|nr:hypothetical protein Cni_G02566 [Canna indica]